MKRLTIKIIIALSTFLVGVASVSIWLIKYHLPKQISESLVRSNQAENNKPGDCIPSFDPNLIDVDKEWKKQYALYSAFKEISLEHLPSCVDESYRLIWVPSFHPPVAVRVWHSGDKYYITSKQLSGLGGYDYGTLKDDNMRSLSEEEWLEFMTLISQSSYWQISPLTEIVPVEDGAEWIVEGVKSGEYRRVIRNVPSRNFADLYRRFISLSGLKTSHEAYLQ